MEFLSTAKPAFWLNLAGGAFILIGLVFVYVTVRQIRGDMDSRSWPQTEAVLQQAELVKHVREREDNGTYRTHVSYLCSLTYRYDVDGNSYTAVDNIRAESRDQAAKMVAGYPPGRQVAIFYSPDDPGDYRFEPGSVLGGLLWLLPFAGFAGFGWAIIYMGKRIYAG